MIITAIVRTHNEKRNLEPFVAAYHDWVDHILIQDDESDDYQYIYDVLDKYSKTLVDIYDGERIERGEISRAKQHIQLNELIEWAESLGSDWIIMDDCDSVPNADLREQGKEILTQCLVDFVYVSRLYLYKDEGYFPKMSMPNGEWAQGLWAWKANKDFRFLDRGDKPQGFKRPKPDNILRLLPPYILIHKPWPTDDVIAEKRIRYTAIYGKDYEKFDPKESSGKLEPLPEWCKL